MAMESLQNSSSGEEESYEEESTEKSSNEKEDEAEKASVMKLPQVQKFASTLGNSSKRVVETSGDAHILKRRKKKDIVAPASGEEEEQSDSNDEEENTDTEEEDEAEKVSATESPPQRLGSTLRKSGKSVEEGIVALAKSKSSDSKLFFQRVWSENDEIELLKGLIDFSSDEPTEDKKSFLDYIKEKQCLQFDVSSARQLSDKMSRLKRKFKNQEKKGGRTAKGHDQLLFDLSKKIWGSDGIDSSGAKSNDMEGKLSLLKEIMKENIDAEYIMKEGLKMFEGKKKVKMEQRLTKLTVASLELFLKKQEFIKECGELMLANMRK